jgi:hypothetical protein
LYQLILFYFSPMNVGDGGFGIFWGLGFHEPPGREGRLISQLRKLLIFPVFRRVKRIMHDDEIRESGGLFRCLFLVYGSLRLCHGFFLPLLLQQELLLLLLEQLLLLLHPELLLLCPNLLDVLEEARSVTWATLLGRLRLG